MKREFDPGFRVFEAWEEKKKRKKRCVICKKILRTIIEKNFKLCKRCDYERYAA